MKMLLFTVHHEQNVSVECQRNFVMPPLPATSSSSAPDDDVEVSERPAVVLRQHTSEHSDSMDGKHTHGNTLMNTMDSM